MTLFLSFRLSAFAMYSVRKPRRRHSRPSATNTKSRKKGGVVKAAKRPKGMALIAPPLSATCRGLMGRKERKCVPQGPEKSFSIHENRGYF